MDKFIPVYQPSITDLEKTVLGDFTKAKHYLNWEPKISFEPLVEDMCVSEMKSNI